MKWLLPFLLLGCTFQPAPVNVERQTALPTTVQDCTDNHRIRIGGCWDTEARCQQQALVEFVACYTLVRELPQIKAEPVLKDPFEKHQ